ncbi:MAG TPA: helix-hairpin-helix domain-containing protein [Anaerolineae bacterium]|nr:helix-hairpin-helix domain-containing protein [Anaerolineae bacterium]
MTLRNNDFNNFWLGVALALFASLVTYWWWLQRRTPMVPSPPPPPPITPPNSAGPKKSPAYLRHVSPPTTKPPTETTKPPANNIQLEIQQKDDLTRIKGIGRVYADRFNDAGIFTFATIATLTPDDIRARLNLQPWQGQPEEWIAQAQQLSQ